MKNSTIFSAQKVFLTSDCATAATLLIYIMQIFKTFWTSQTWSELARFEWSNLRHCLQNQNLEPIQKHFAMSRLSTLL